MPLTGSATALAALMKSEIIAENSKVGLAPPDPKALTSLTTAVARAIITHFLAQGQVAPGIPTAGSPAAQATTAPGKLI